MLSDQVIKNYEKRAQFVAHKFGFPELAEDFIQEMFLRFIEGEKKGAILDHIFIDYLRDTFGRPGSYKNDFTRSLITLEKEPETTLPIPCWWEDNPSGHGFEFLFLKKSDRKLYYERYYLEKTCLEIGLERGLSESRISQMLNPIKEKIREYLNV